MWLFVNLDLGTRNYTILCYGYFIRPMSHLCGTYIHRSHMNVSVMWGTFLLRVLISLVGKMSCCQIRDVGFDSHLHQNQLLCWPDDKEHSSWCGYHRFKYDCIYRKKWVTFFTWVHGFQNCHWILKQKKEFDSNSW